MKKYLSALVLVSILVLPLVGQTATIAEQIAALQAQLAQLMAQLAQQDSSTTSCSPVPTINRNLEMGSVGEDVYALQRYLIDEGLLNRKVATHIYDLPVKEAVINWQKANNVYPANGYFGPISRLALGQLCGNSNSGSVVINSITSPTSLKVGEVGTWQVNITAPADSAITYQVAWGEMDGYAGASTKGLSASLVNQTGTFTHAYNQAGTYTVKFIVYAKGLEKAKSSVTVVVENNNQGVVPIANFTGGPVKLTRTHISAAFIGTIKASGGDIYLIKDRPMVVALFNQTRNIDTNTLNCRTTYYDYGINLPTVYDEYERPLSLLTKNRTVSYKVEISCPINELLSGVHYGRANYIPYLTSLNQQNSATFYFKEVRSSDSLYIVGEQGPWISGATFDINSRKVIITGERLNQVTSVTVGTLNFSSPNWFSNWVIKTDNKITIQESKTWPTGSLPVFVSSVIGKSNQVNLKIFDETIQSPAITVLSPNGGEVFAKDSTITGSFLASKIKVGIPFTVSLVGKAYEKVVFNGRVYSADRQNFSFVIPSDVDVNNYYRVMVRSTVDGTILEDSSDNYFTISNSSTPDGQVAPIVLYPNGGEVLISGQPKYITWDPKIHYGYFNVSIKGVTSGNEFIVKQNVLSNYAARMEIPWTPEAVSKYEERTNTFIIRVCRVGMNLCDESDRPFTITSNNTTPPSTTLYHPADLNKNYLIERSELDAYAVRYQAGQVTLTQLTRVTQFFNSAGYKCQSGTEDGFAPIPKTTNSASKQQLNQLANIAEALQKLADQLR